MSTDREGEREHQREHGREHGRDSDRPFAFRLSLRRRAAVDVDDEFAFHLDMRANELVARGWEPGAARAEAQRQFGDLDDARNFCRTTDQRMERRLMRGELWNELRQDLSYAMRTLSKAPGFTLVAALTLALGIGANTAIFSVVRGILLRPLPFRDPGQLVMVEGVYGIKPTPYVSPANAFDWRAQNRSFSSMAIMENQSAVLTGAGDPTRLRGYAVTADFFPMLGVNAVRGRLNFAPEEVAWKGAKAVLLSEPVFRTRFGSDSALIGTFVTLDNERYRVVGVVPAAAAWPSDAELWFPFTFDPAGLANSRGAVYLNVIARLKPGVTVSAAAQDMTAIGARLAAQYPDANAGLGATVEPLMQFVTGEFKRPLYVLLGGVGFVLLIACANVANLLLVRGVSREGELAVRTALGASRGRLVRQLVTESAILTLLGGGVGLALAVIGTRVLVRGAPTSIPRLQDIHVDGVVLAFAIAMALITGTLFGLIPARQVVSPDLARTLREGGRTIGARRGSQRARAALVIAELALSVMLLAGAGLLIRSFNRLMAVDPGFRTENSVSFSLSLPDVRYDSPQKQALFMRTLMERLHQVPGVQRAGAAMSIPLTLFGFNFSFSVRGRPPVKAGDEPSAEVRVATPEFFTAMGIRMVKGRAFSEADRDGAPNAILITETAANTFFPGENPIGQRLKIDWGYKGSGYEGDIVGVVSDVKQSSLARATLPQMYVAYDQRPISGFVVVLHGTRDLNGMVADARRVVRELDADLAVTKIKTLDQVVYDSVARPRFYMSLLSAFAVVALLLSAIGIYGVIAYLVGQRAREIGIRLALGATPMRVVRLVVREGALMTAAGLMVGLGGALGLSRLMGSLLFDVQPTDVLTYVAVTTVLALVAISACVVPALRASRVDPVVALRAEG